MLILSNNITVISTKFIIGLALNMLIRTKLLNIVVVVLLLIVVL